jgi:ribulose-phosphate 3-epimerase
MISNPDRHAETFISAGADILTFHAEVFIDETTKKFNSVGALSLAKEIKSAGVSVGISIKPATSLELIKPYLNEFDLVLIMSVEPGFGGQKFIEGVLKKVSALRRIYNLDIEIDGGINDVNAKLAKKAGVNILVSGTFIFSSSDMAESIKRLKEASND